MQAAGCEIRSCEVTDRRLYLKAVAPKMQEAIKVNDPVQAGLVISNSEVGAGSLRVEPLIFRLVCANGMIAGSSVGSMQQRHAGARQGLDALISEFQSDATRNLHDRAFWSAVRDTIEGVLKPENFQRIIELARLASDRRFESNDLQAIVDVTAKKVLLQEEEAKGVLRHLIDGGELNQWGLLNAITRQSQDAKSYDRATELEMMGGEILDLSERD